MLIRDRLDAAFVAEPPQIPVEQRLAAGRAALRRRRIGQSAAAVAAVAVISVGSVALTGRSADSGRQLAPATGGTTSQTSAPDVRDPVTQATERWPYPGQLAYVDSRGILRLAPRAELIEKVPLHVPDGAPVDGDVELAVTVGTKVWWVSISYEDGKRAIPNQLVGPFTGYNTTRFQDFVLQRRFTVAPGNTSSSDPTGPAISADERLVRFDHGALVAEAGVVIQQQRPDPGFANFNPDGEAVAVAEVRVQDNGTHWFVVARDNGDGTTQNISARPGVGPVPTDLDDFITWAGHRYDSGVGLL